MGFAELCAFMGAYFQHVGATCCAVLLAVRPAVLPAVLRRCRACLVSYAIGSAQLCTTVVNVS
jgi:hypothetical protein